ncbi:MAG: hypothetical protein M1438_00015 [Deltaproteobacteria bacterium]|nr:hypothetical protein [Deltaproteobacteria bacterium]
MAEDSKYDFLIQYEENQQIIWSHGRLNGQPVDGGRARFSSDGTLQRVREALQAALERLEGQLKLSPGVAFRRELYACNQASIGGHMLEERRLYQECSNEKTRRLEAALLKTIIDFVQEEEGVTLRDLKVATNPYVLRNALDKVPISFGPGARCIFPRRSCDWKIPGTGLAQTAKDSASVL